MDNPIQRYLEDAIAAEAAFETQLNGFAGEATSGEARKTFRAHARETGQQRERLTARLQALGGEPSTVKGFLAQVFNMAPKLAQLGHTAEERATQDLIMAYAVENAETAMYESMIITAEAVSDHETAELARRIQAQEKDTAGRIWSLIAPTATQAWSSLSAPGGAQPKEIILRYLQDAEAAERNFEDALAGFGKIGDQTDVRNLMSMMSHKAQTQHQRLESRLRALGGAPSAAKSILAHMLALAPVSAQIGQSASEKSTQHLVIVFAAASAEMGMYESLAATAEAAGDRQTVELARQLQSEEEQDHALAWDHLGRSARSATLRALRA